MLGNLSVIRPPLTCPFVGKAFETFFRELELDPLSDIWYPSFSDLDLIFSNDEIQTFLYYGNPVEASFLGAKAGQNIKPFLSECNFDRVHVLAESGDFERFVEGLEKARRASFGPKYTQPMRLWVHESRLDSVEKKIASWVQEINSGDCCVSLWLLFIFIWYCSPIQIYRSFNLLVIAKLENYITIFEKEFKISNL